MSEQRTMMVPGQGIVRPSGATFDHNEYPKHLAHKDYQPGQVGPKAIVGGFEKGIEYNLPGTPVRFPPQLVYSKNQEDYYIAQGYHVVGKSDPDAFRRAVTNMPDPNAHREIQMYPKWVNGVLCTDAAQEAAQLGRLAAEKEAMDHPAVEAGHRWLAEADQTPQAPAKIPQATAASPPPVDADQMRFMQSIMDQMKALTAMMGEMRGDIDELKGGASPAPAPAQPQLFTHGDRIRAGQKAAMERRQAEPAVAPPLPTPPVDRPLTQIEKMRLGRERARARREAEAKAAAEAARPAPRKAAPKSEGRVTGSPDDFERQLAEDRKRTNEEERKRAEAKAKEAREGLAFLGPTDDAA